MSSFRIPIVFINNCIIQNICERVMMKADGKIKNANGRINSNNGRFCRTIKVS